MSRKTFVHVLLSGLALLGAVPAFAQTEGPPSYRSEADELLSIDKISVLPFSDTLQGIYARPLEAHLIGQIERMHRWDFVPANVTTTGASLDDLEASPEKVLALTKDAHVDAVFAGQITKGPDGVSIHLSLFLTKDGKLVAQAVLKNDPRFDLGELKVQLSRLMTEVVNRLPYAGRVLSRDANRVTLNLGANDGIKKDQVLNVVQVLQLQRHPKFGFLIRTEKEIIGQVRVNKADETLSFATVTMEKEPGTVRKGAKIGVVENVVYATDRAPDAEDPRLPSRDDTRLAFGENARPWVPTAPPTIGSVGVRLGIGRYVGSTQLAQVGGLDATDALSPSISLDGELWITPEWTVGARVRQGLATVSNPRAGSKPARLNQSVSMYDINVGYSFRFGEVATAPSVEPFLGYFLHRLYTDDSSPLAFTTTRYQGFELGVRGSAPIGDGAYGVGGEFAAALGPSLTEAPVTSGGSPSNTVIQFGLFGYKKVGERLRVVAALDFEMYATNFSGAGDRGSESATSASQRYTTFSAGLNYMF